MKHSPICSLICTAFAVGIVSCNSGAPKVDVGWVGEYVSQPKNDTVINESGQNLPQLASQPTAPQTRFAPRWTWLSQMQQQPQYQPQPTGPTPPATKPVYQPQSANTYVVRSGDYLNAIAARYGVSVEALISANKCLADNPNKLKPGQVLLIPAANAPKANRTPLYPLTPPQNSTPSNSSYRTYTVVQGDTLTSIARRHGVSVSAIKTLNGIAPDQENKIRVGQTIKLPLK